MQTNFRVPPQCLEIEESFLAGLLLFAGDHIEVAADVLVPEDFYKSAHQQIFRVCLNLYNRKEPIDLNTVFSELKLMGVLESVGGGSYLARLADVNIPASAEAYCDRIKKHSVYRQIIDKCNRIILDAFDAKVDAVDLLDNAQSELGGIDYTGRDTESISVADLVDGAVDNLEALYNRECTITGVPTGFRDVDEKLCGFQGSDLIILAGRPGMGKSAFAFNCAANQASTGFKPLIFSLEMSKKQYINRNLSMISCIDNMKFRSGRFDPKEWEGIVKAAGKIAKWDAYIDDSPGLTVGEIRRRTRRGAYKHGVNIVYIDYLKFVKSAVTKKRYIEVGDITEGLKNMAKELDIPVVLVAQLNRKCEERSNKRPILSDLRESGDVEQDADVVAFLYRDDYYKKNSKDAGIAEVILAKHRNGPTGTIKLHWHEQYTKFNDLAWG